MARKPIIVEYKGEQVKIRELAINRGLSNQLLIDRWREAGEPEEITDEIINSAAHSRHKLFGVTYNGKPVESCMALAKQLGISPGLVSSRVKKHGKTLLPIHLASQKKQIDPQPEPLKIDHSDKSPGWLERQLFPNTGNNGFSKGERAHFTGSSSSGMPVYQD